MILVDTSVWIDYFNGADTKQTKVMNRILAEERIMIGDLILIELLQGFGREKDFQTAKILLGSLEYVTLSNKQIAMESVNNYRILRKKGVTVRKTIDVIIASYCIFHNIPLLHNDRDFNAMEKHLGLACLT